jgi:tRNA (guanine9-N1)-methyltransferase
MTNIVTNTLKLWCLNLGHRLFVSSENGCITELIKYPKVGIKRKIGDPSKHSHYRVPARRQSKLLFPTLLGRRLVPLLKHRGRLSIQMGKGEHGDDGVLNPQGNTCISENNSMARGEDDEQCVKTSDDAVEPVLKTEESSSFSFQAAVVAPSEANDSTEKLSKNQKKKLARIEYCREKKRKRTELRKQIRMEKAQAEGRDLEKERRLQEEATKRGDGKALRMKLWQKSFKPNETFAVCVDCSFEKDMVPKEINSLAIQLRYIYSANKKSKLPLSLVFSDVDQEGKMIGHLKNVSGFEEWESYGLTISTLPIEQVFQERLRDLVYLTSDAPTVLDKLDSGKVYVIGGIVDRNRLRGATVERANKLNITTRRLPISEHLKSMASTKVLTCKHVFDLLLEVRDNNGDWRNALVEILPSRKEAQA